MKCPRCGKELSLAPGAVNYCENWETGCGINQIMLETNTPRPGETPEQTAARYRERDPLLVERQKTHGDFEDNAIVSQALKGIMASAKLYPEEPVFREALDMIALKLSRILSGQADYKDHWRDISGYALLAMEACK